MLFAAIGAKTLISLAVFGLIGLATWWLLELMATSKPSAEDRLDEMANPRSRRRRGDAQVVTTSQAMANVLAKASPAFAKPLQPKTALEASRLKCRLSQAGFRHEAAPSIYLGMKTAMLGAGLFFGGGTALVNSGLSQQTIVTTVGVAGVMFFLPDALLGYLGMKRREAIFMGLPDALDLLVVCVEAGLGLDQAMRKVSEEMKKSTPAVSNEFALCNFQLQMGRARNEVLHELGQRTGVDDLRSLAAILIQADKFGSSIAQALRVQSDSMRTRRKQMAEEKAAKTAVKLIFPLVLFIFPAIFVVLVGPAAITIVNEMFPMMQGTK